MSEARTGQIGRIGLIGQIVLCAGVAWGSSTQDMRVEGSASFLEGKFSGSGLNDLGELVTGHEATRTSAVEDAAYMMCYATHREQLYFGAGYPAALIVYDGQAAKRMSSRFGSDFAVSALASDGRSLYAATLPSATIYQVTERGETSVFIDFSTGAVTPNYVWSLAAHKNQLYAALGGHFPSVYKIDLKTAKKELLHKADGKAKNITALLVGDDAIYFGDDLGRVYRQATAGGAGARATVLYSFSDAEIKALAMFNGGLAVAVNNRRFVPPPPMAPGGPKEEPRPPGEGGGEEGEMGLGADLKKAIEAMAETVGEKLKSPAPPPPAPAKPESPAAQPPSTLPPYQDPFGKGEGNLFWMSLDGSRVHKLWYSQSSIALSLWPEGSGVWVATSNPGRLYRITAQGSERLYYESASKDLSVICPSGKKLIAAASNPAAVLELEPSRRGEYTTKAFDAGFPARLGQPEAYGAGRDQTEVWIRSGATSEIDSGWTDFELLSGAPTTTGRFFQAKLRLKSPDGAIRRLRLPYRVQNLYPKLINLSAEVVRSQDGAPDGRDIRFQWDVTNLDNDQLQYQLSYQPPGSKKFIPIYDPSTQPKNVKSVNVPSEPYPDGTYRFKLEVSDKPSNGAGDALAHEQEFPLILLDRTPPSVDVKPEGDRVQWRATDAHSRVSRAEYRVDGGAWETADPDDRLFDSMEETGRIDLKGRAVTVVDVRCYDERENVRIQSLILK